MKQGRIGLFIMVILALVACGTPPSPPPPATATPLATSEEEMEECNEFLDNQDREAVTCYENLIEGYPDYPDIAKAHYNLGASYYDRGTSSEDIIVSDIEHAIADYTQAIDRNIAYVEDAYYERGLAYYELGQIDAVRHDFEQARKEVQALLDLQPDDEYLQDFLDEINGKLPEEE